MSEYLDESINALLKTASMYARLRNFDQANKVYKNAIAKAEAESDPSNQFLLKESLEQYAMCLHTQKRFDEAEECLARAKSLQVRPPDPDSLAKPSPSLPIEYKASRLDKDGKTAIPVTLIVLGMLAVALMVEALKLPGSFAIASYVVVPALVIYFWVKRGMVDQEKARTCWCRLTEDGIEYKEPGRSYSLRWNEIENAMRACDTGVAEDDALRPTLTVKGRNQKFKISACYFTDDEVFDMQRAVRDHCPRAKKDWGFRQLL